MSEGCDVDGCLWQAACEKAEAEAAQYRSLLVTLAERLETEIRPLLDKDKHHEGGYNCCGCSTYDAILDHAIRIVQRRDP